MADRIALSIEPDNGTADQIKKFLEPRGFRVHNIPNGDDAMEWGRTNKPSVIILSVEPRKVGYAISNKLRRSPSLREVPLVMISSEETLATFEQHKKLKSRADEYLLKPLEESVFIAKVAGLAPTGGGGGDSDGDGDDEVHELDADSDIVLADDDDDIIVSSSDDDEETTTLMGGDGERVGDSPSRSCSSPTARRCRSRVKSSIPRRRRRLRRWRPGRPSSRRRATTWSICATCGRTTICRRILDGSRLRPTWAAARSMLPPTRTSIAPARRWGRS